MKRRILKSVSLLVALSILLTFILMNFVVYQKTVAEMQHSVENESAYIEAALKQYGESYLTQEIGALTESRITLIDSDGDVLFESNGEPEAMENHRERPEIAEAMKHGAGSTLRVSSTLAQEMFYYAVRLDDGRILRVCRTTDSVLANIWSSVGVIAALFVVFVIAVIVAVDRMAKWILGPIDRINLNDPLTDVEYEELGPLLGRIDEQNQQIREQMRSLRQKQEEYLAITEHMKDGLIIIGTEAVLSINRSAQQIFGVIAETCLGRDIITVSRDEKLRGAVSQARQGNPGECQLTVGNEIYQVLSNPVRSKSGKVTGIVILLLDITEKQRAEQMRREFTANVSHELKTPLMTISGYAEIIKNGMVRPEDVTEFSERIYTEAQRLSSLVEDILHLSWLDEDHGKETVGPIELMPVIRRICDRLQMKATKADVQLSVTGENLVVNGVTQVLDEMIYNLCDNAINYNIPGGSVEISLRQEQNQVIAAVRDTGIGISKEEQERIFERFYRVDKSHSRKSGGTGLGLAIVKRAALFHDASIELVSEPGTGTTIQVIFPQVADKI